MTAILRSPFFRAGACIAAPLLLVSLLFPGFLRSLLSTGSFMPHATCYLQDRGIIWLHVTTDLLIGLAYVVIATTLGYLVYKASKDIPFHWVFLAFGIFIIACGFTHFMEVVTVWQAVYWLAGYVKVITAVASVTTAVALFPLVPKVFATIREVKAAEERRVQLERTHRELEKANSELADQKAELLAANRDLEMFAHSVAHDLKAPARAVAGYSSILEEEHGPDLNADARHLLTRVAESSKRMERLLSDMLQYTTVSRTTMELEPIPLQTTIDDALALVETERAAVNALIETEVEPVVVLVNRTMMLQILTNLLSNAIKYVAPGVRPKVKISARRSGPLLRVSVQDNGIGIAPQVQEEVFRMFTRLHSQSEYEGTGVGLAIVRRGAERMGGRSGLDSAVGQGSTFWVEVRLADANLSPASAP